MDCDLAMRAAARLESETTEAAGPALQHILGCPACLTRLDRLARSVLGRQPDEIGCAEGRDRMAALLAEPAPGSTAWLAGALAHLRGCPDCAAEAGGLAAALDRWQAGLLPILQETPAFDLAFLDSLATSQPAAWLRERIAALGEAGTMVHRLSADILVEIGQEAARFGRMLGGLQARPAGAMALRDASGPAAEMLEVRDEASDLVLRLAIGPAAEARAVIALKLRRESDAGALAGLRVVLYDAETRLLASALTADDGGTQFVDLVAGRYLLEVRRPDGRWQLPLVLGAGADEPRA
jgi:hypothetical protein